MSERPQAPYEQLLTLGICELELAQTGRIPELLACQQARADLIATLPPVPPPEARPALERCAAIAAQLDGELRRARASILEALAEVRQAQRAADGYTPVRERLHLVEADA